MRAEDSYRSGKLATAVHPAPLTIHATASIYQRRFQMPPMYEIIWTKTSFMWSNPFVYFAKPALVSLQRTISVANSYTLCVPEPATQTQFSLTIFWGIFVRTGAEAMDRNKHPDRRPCSRQSSLLNMAQRSSLRLNLQVV